MVMVGLTQSTICQWIQLYGGILMMMATVITSEVRQPMLVQTRQEHQPSIVTAVSMLTATATRRQRKVGVSIVEQMPSQAIQRNGVISMRMVSVITMETLHGLSDLRIGLEPTSMVHKIKMHVLCNQEPVGKTVFSVVLIPMVTDGGMFKMHSLPNLHSGLMRMVMAMVITKVASMQMLVQTLQETLVWIALDVLIPMATVTPHQI